MTDPEPEPPLIPDIPTEETETGDRSYYSSFTS